MLYRHDLMLMCIFRFGKSKECASVVSMLVSEDGSYITGENIVVGGGAPSRL